MFLDVFKDAQAAVNQSQKTYDLHLRGLANGNGNANGSSKLPADHPEAVAATTQWAALRSTSIQAHTEVFPDMEILDEYDQPFDFHVLPVEGTLPFASSFTDTTFIVERDFYPSIMDIVKTHAGGQYRILLRGAPGIGKSGAIGAYVLHGVGQLMNAEGEQCRIKRVVLSSPQSKSKVYNLDGTVDILTDDKQFETLACLSDAVWLMDEEEHGPFLDARGVTCLVASADPENYNTYWKKAQRLCWVANWDSNGRMSKEGLPLELEALIRVLNAANVCDVTIPRAVEHFYIAGALPRDIIEDPGRAKKQINRIVCKLSMEDVQKLTAKHADLIDAHLNHRLANPYVNRETMEEDDSTLVIASEYVRQLLLQKQNAGD